MKLSHCPTHAMVLDAAREEMATTKRFMKESVMAATPFPRKVWELIQWPFIRETIEQELGGEPLQPVATPTTTGNGHAWDPEIHPEKFLPGARNPTAGYALPSAVAPAVARAYAQRRYNMARGWAQSTDRLLSAYQRQGVISGYRPISVPPLQLTA